MAKALTYCRNPQCRRGVLGSLAGKVFVPSGHLTAGKDVWTEVDQKGRQVTVVRCTFCKREHRVEVDDKQTFTVSMT